MSEPIWFATTRNRQCRRYTNEDHPWGIRKCILWVYIYIYIHTYIHLIFIIQRVKACSIPCPHQPPTRGDNTVSIAQDGTATPGTTKQLLPQDRVFKRITHTHTHTHIHTYTHRHTHTHTYIYIYIYAWSIKSKDYIGRSSFLFAVFDLKKQRVYFRPLMLLHVYIYIYIYMCVCVCVCVCVCCEIPNGLWNRNEAPIHSWYATTRNQQWRQYITEDYSWGTWECILWLYIYIYMCVCVCVCVLFIIYIYIYI